MSKGGFTGKGVFGTLSYLVVVYEDGKEKQCNFKHEEDVDRFVAYIEENIRIFRYTVLRLRESWQRRKDGWQKSKEKEMYRKKQKDVLRSWNRQNSI